MVRPRRPPRAIFVDNTAKRWEISIGRNFIPKGDHSGNTGRSLRPTNPERRAIMETTAQSNEDRAKIYGLAEADLHLTNLVLGEDECIRLSGREDSPHSKSAHRIPVNSVADLKRMIGLPDAVAQARCHRCPEGLAELPAPTFNTKADLTPGQIAVLRLAAEEYVHGNSAIVSQFVPVIDRVIGLISNANIIGVFYQDITVER